MNRAANRNDAAARNDGFDSAPRGVTTTGASRPAHAPVASAEELAGLLDPGLKYEPVGPDEVTVQSAAGSEEMASSSTEKTLEQAQAQRFDQ